MNRITYLFLVGMFLPLNAHAYLEINHELMSRNAANKSVLNKDPVTQKNLGLPPFNSKTPTYPGSDGGKRTAEDTVAFGAWNEDNDGSPSGKVAWRSLHHFYNPQAQNGPVATQGLAGVMRSSPSWMFEDTSGVQGVTLGLAPTLDQQEFSYWDARKYQYCLLSGGSDCKIANNPASGAELRNANAGLMLQALGHLIHHVQDMAQPQHVRDDAHCHVGNVDRGEGPPFDECYYAEGILKVGGATAISAGLVSKSIPEILGGLYLAQVKVHEPSAFESTAGDIFPPLGNDYVGYDGYTTPVTFPKPQEFWSNSKSSGMADFTSRNFVSQETQFAALNAAGADFTDPTKLQIGPASALPMPDGSSTRVYSVPMTGFSEQEVKSINGKTYFVEKKFTDNYNGQLVTVSRMSAVNMFFDPLHWRPGGSVNQLYFEQNKYTLLDHYKVLLPRAVAFSTGLINYFFRGKLGEEHLTVSATKQKIRFQNLSTTEAMKGTIELFTDLDGVRARVFNVSVDLAPGAWTSWTEFTWTGAPHAYQAYAVFRGALGAEGDVAANSAVKNVTSKQIYVISQQPNIDIVFDGAQYRFYNRSVYKIAGKIRLKQGDKYTGDWSIDLGANSQSAPVSIAAPAGAYTIDFSGYADGFPAIAFDRTVTLPMSGVSCAGPFSNDVNNAGLNTKLELGSAPGSVEFEFDAYSVPGSAEVWSLDKSGNKVSKIASTGTASGFKSLKFNHSPSSTVNTKVTLIIATNTNNLALRTFTLGCPGVPISDTNRKHSRRAWQIQTTDLNAFSTQKCATDFTVDGISIGKLGWVGYSGAVASVTPTFSTGTHSYKYNVEVCTPALQAGKVPPYKINRLNRTSGTFVVY